ncbi:hypothetical protein Tco_0969522 [Tanacetum coccineum]
MAAWIVVVERGEVLSQGALAGSESSGVMYEQIAMVLVLELFQSTMPIITNISCLTFVSSLFSLKSRRGVRDEGGCRWSVLGGDVFCVHGSPRNKPQSSRRDRGVCCSGLICCMRRRGGFAGRNRSVIFLLAEHYIRFDSKNKRWQCWRVLPRGRMCLYWLDRREG